MVFVISSERSKEMKAIGYRLAVIGALALGLGTMDAVAGQGRQLGARDGQRVQARDGRGREAGRGQRAGERVCEAGQGAGRGEFRQGDGQGRGWHRDGTAARGGVRRQLRDGTCVAE